MMIRVYSAVSCTVQWYLGMRGVMLMKRRRARARARATRLRARELVIRTCVPAGRRAAARAAARRPTRGAATGGACYVYCRSLAAELQWTDRGVAGVQHAI